MFQWDVFMTRAKDKVDFYLKCSEIFVLKLTGTIPQQQLMNVRYLHQRKKKNTLPYSTMVNAARMKIKIVGPTRNLENHANLGRVWGVPGQTVFTSSCDSFSYTPHCINTVQALSFTLNQALCIMHQCTNVKTNT